MPPSRQLLCSFTSCALFFDQICICVSVIDLSFSQIWQPVLTKAPNTYFSINFGYFCFQGKTFIYEKKFMGAA